MDMMKIAREIGFFETGINLEKVLDSNDVRSKAGAVMPLPDTKIVDNMKEIAQWLTSLGKTKYMFLTPEIAVIEEIALLSNLQESIILVPCDMEEEIRERLKENLPREMEVFLLREPYFPELFFPGNGIVIVCGYIAGDRIMVLPETYRLIEHYGGFWGQKVFIPFTEIVNAVRYKGWMEVSVDKFSAIWRKNDE